MDLTTIFETSVKNVRQRNKSLPPPDKNRIFKKVPTDEFSIKTRDICKQITELRDLLLENRTAYMRFGCHLKSAAQMTDEERNIIDQESEKIISICAQFIGELRSNIRRQKVTEQNANHMECVLELLQMYLRNVFKIYNEQKAYRVQYELDTYKLLKLESNRKLIPQIPVRERAQLFEYDDDDDNVSGTRRADDDNMMSDGSASDYGEDDADNEDNDDETDDKELNRRHDGRDDRISSEKRKQQQRLSTEKATALDQDLASKFSLEADEITAEDIQMFESENVQLYNELKGLSDEVEQIEKNVVDIAKLQDIFTEKVKFNFFMSYIEIVNCFIYFQVTVQQADIERIANTVVGATENVNDANEQIKEAIQRNAGLRVWVLFFLLVMSFSLLFLDWYND